MSVFTEGGEVEEEEEEEQDFIDPSSIQSSLPVEINKATRKIHRELNRLVTLRLPLALPPQKGSPQAYHVGLDTFGQVYRAFEEIWHTHLDHRSQSPDPSRLRHVLTRLMIPHLSRTEALVEDGAYLTTLLQEIIPDHHHHHHHHDADEHSRKRPRLMTFISHIQTSTTRKPHLLIAYAWIFYMALFSGGRWIRAQLYAAGEDFWSWKKTTTISSSSSSSSSFDGTENHRRRYHRDGDEDEDKERGKMRLRPQNPSSVNSTPTTTITTTTTTSSSSPIQPGLSFFHFSTLNDGEDLKHLFKARLNEIEPLLTLDERREIIDESVLIFRSCISLVEELDHFVPRMSSSSTASISKSIPKSITKEAEQEEQEEQHADDLLTTLSKSSILCSPPSFTSSSSSSFGSCFSINQPLSFRTLFTASSYLLLSILALSLAFTYFLYLMTSH